MAVWLFFKLMQSVLVCLQYMCRISLKEKLWYVGRKRRKLLPQRTTKVKGEAFYESQDKVTEEKCLSSE